jgi:hypothetical protein
MNRMNPRARSNLPSDANGKSDSLPHSPTRHAMRLVRELGAKVVRAVHEAEQRGADGTPNSGVDAPATPGGESPRRGGNPGQARAPLDAVSYVGGYRRARGSETAYANA